MGELPRFARHTIYSGGPSERTLCVVGDVDGDGVPEVMIGARSPRGAPPASTSHSRSGDDG